MKRLLVFVCISLSISLAGCASSSHSGSQVIEFETLTLERARARVGRAVIMGMTSAGSNGETRAPGDVAIVKIGGQSIAARYHSIILDSVRHSVGIRLDDGSGRFFSLPLKMGKRYLVLTHRYTDETGQAPKKALDLWVQDVDTDEVVYGERSEKSRLAMQQPARARQIEQHRKHLRSLFLDAS